MKFTPVSEEKPAPQSAGVWENGIYDYEVRDAEETISSAGNEMIKLVVCILNKAGDQKILYEYLVGTEKAAWKVREFAASCGLLRQYETGSLMAAEIVGRTGMCEVGTRAAEGRYEAKNTVRSWIGKADSAKTPSPPRTPLSREKKPAGPDLDDEIPF